MINFNNLNIDNFNNYIKENKDLNLIETLKSFKKENNDLYIHKYDNDIKLYLCNSYSNFPMELKELLKNHVDEVCYYYFCFSKKDNRYYLLSKVYVTDYHKKFYINNVYSYFKSKDILKDRILNNYSKYCSVLLSFIFSNLNHKIIRLSVGTNKEDTIKALRCYFKSGINNNYLPLLIDRNDLNTIKSVNYTDLDTIQDKSLDHFHHNLIFLNKVFIKEFQNRDKYYDKLYKRFNYRSRINLYETLKDINIDNYNIKYEYKQKKCQI